MKAISFPAGFSLQRIQRDHPRRAFRCGEPAVDQWIATKALQHQTKHLSVTHVLVDPAGSLAGYYTLATGQIDFGDLPSVLTKQLPRRVLPVAVLAWLGVHANYQGQGIGRRLLAQALRDCWEAGKTFPFVAIVLDCVSEPAKAFYQQWNFAELPGHPMRLFLSARQLEAIVQSQ